MWFISSFVRRGLSSKVFILFLITHCFLEILWRLRVFDISATSLGENQLILSALSLDNNGFPLVSNNIWLISNICSSSNIWFPHPVPSRSHNQTETWVTTYISSIKGVILSLFSCLGVCLISTPIKPTFLATYTH